MSDLEIEAILPPNHRYMNAKQFGATIPFPQHPLVPYHHGVRIDTIKLFLVMDVFVQPFKAPSMRWYPRGFQQICTGTLRLVSQSSRRGTVKRREQRSVP